MGPTGKDNSVTFISLYAPTMMNPDLEKETFYNQLTCTLKHAPLYDKLILMRDFNARIGSDHDKWPKILEKHGLDKTTFMHPRWHWHRIDFIITRHRKRQTSKLQK